jgi:hypothetical protein
MLLSNMPAKVMLSPYKRLCACGFASDWTRHGEIKHDESHRDLLGSNFFDDERAARDLVNIFEVDGHLFSVVSFRRVAAAKIAGPLLNWISGFDSRAGRICLLWVGAMFVSADVL